MFYSRLLMHDRRRAPDSLAADPFHADSVVQSFPWGYEPADTCALLGKSLICINAQIFRIAGFSRGVRRFLRPAARRSGSLPLSAALKSAS
jgi:hypothetical protein